MCRNVDGMIRCGITVLMILGACLDALAADEITLVEKVLSNPSGFHRHDVVLNGALKLVGRWEGKDAMGKPTCGPIFKLDDDTGEIPVMYVIRCDPTEESAATSMAGGRAIVHATIEAATVMSAADGSEYKTRALASKIRREEK